MSLIPKCASLCSVPMSCNLLAPKQLFLLYMFLMPERWKKGGELNFPDMAKMTVWLNLRNSETSTEVVFRHLHVRIKYKKRANNWKLFTDFLNEEMSEILSGKTHRWSEPCILWEGQKKNNHQSAPLRHWNECRARGGVPKVDANHWAWVDSSRLYRAGKNMTSCGVVTCCKN